MTLGREYNHWFWNSKLIMRVSKSVSNLNAWLWRKQYAKK
jgi:hypothetical protein